jgi:hypothetical protein
MPNTVAALMKMARFVSNPLLNHITIPRGSTEQSRVSHLPSKFLYPKSRCLITSSTRIAVHPPVYPDNSRFGSKTLERGRMPFEIGLVFPTRLTFDVSRFLGARRFDARIRHPVAQHRIHRTVPWALLSSDFAPESHGWEMHFSHSPA